MSTPLLENGREYPFTFLQIDVVNSSLIKGARLLKDKMLESLKDFLASRISYGNGFEISYGLDGGVWGFVQFEPERESRHIRAVKVAIDILNSMEHYNSFCNPFTNNDITLRISLLAANACYKDDKSLISGKELSMFMKREREFSSADTVTITKDIYDELDTLSTDFDLEGDMQFEEQVISLYRYKRNNSRSGNGEIQYDAKELCQKISEMQGMLKNYVSEYDTIYDERTTHYKEEKECMARHYIEFLENRVVSALNCPEIKKVVILLDSGTTLVPIFDNLGQKSNENSNYFTKHANVNIYTNNIRGILRLFKYKKNISRYESLPFDCSVLPGKVLAPYEAFADEYTIKAIADLKRSGVYVISITTGNYIIYNDIQNIFLPIARAGFHPHVKSAMYYAANEVHVVAPLGKVLINNYNSQSIDMNDNINKTLHKFNTSLGYLDETVDEKNPYKLITPDLLTGMVKEITSQTDQFEWCKKTILITTSRDTFNARRYWLSDHYFSIFNRLNRSLPDTFCDPNVTTPSAYIYSIPFDGLPYSTDLQPKVEIPHKNLRNKQLLHQFFKVDINLPD